MRSARRGPCGDGLQEWRVQREYACVDGNRGSLRDDGCSAERYACSLEISLELLGQIAQDNLSTLRHTSWLSQEPAQVFEDSSPEHHERRNNLPATRRLDLILSEKYRLNVAHYKSGNIQ